MSAALKSFTAMRRRRWRERLFTWPWRPWCAWAREGLPVREATSAVIPPLPSVERASRLNQRPGLHRVQPPLYAPGTASDDFADTVVMPREAFIPAPLDWPPIDTDSLPMPFASGSGGDFGGGGAGAAWADTAAPAQATDPTPWCSAGDPGADTPMNATQL